MKNLLMNKISRLFINQACISQKIELETIERMIIYILVHFFLLFFKQLVKCHLNDTKD